MISLPPRLPRRAARMVPPCRLMRWRKRRHFVALDQLLRRCRRQPGMRLGDAPAEKPKVTGSDDDLRQRELVHHERDRDASPARARRRSRARCRDSAPGVADAGTNSSTQIARASPAGTSKGKARRFSPANASTSGTSASGHGPACPSIDDGVFTVEVVDAIQPRRRQLPAPVERRRLGAHAVQRAAGRVHDDLKRLPLAARRLEPRFGLARRHRRRETPAPSAPTTRARELARVRRASPATQRHRPRASFVTPWF